MPEFDIDAYLQKQVDGRQAPARPSPKTVNLDVARADKMAALDALVAQKKIALPGPVASFGVGSNRLLEAGGTLYGLATGDMDNAAREVGKSGAEYFEERKPLELQLDEEDRREEIDAADGQLDKFGTAITSTLDNPNLLVNLLAEQAPNFIPGGVVGRVAGAGATVLGASANVASRVATASAVGTGAAQQSADVAGGVYDELMALPEEKWTENGEYTKLRDIFGAQKAKESIARTQASLAAAGSAATSILSQLLPGGAAIEKALAGAKKGTGSVIKGAVTGALGEAAQEAIEEGTGAVAGNLAKQVIDESVEVLQGVGEAAGLGAVGGGVLGGPAGAAGGAVKKLAARANKSETATEVEKAMVDGDVSGLTDPEKVDTYSPVAAATVLSIRAATLEDPEAKAAARAELDTQVGKQLELVEGLKSELAGLDENSDEYATTADKLIEAMTSAVAMKKQVDKVVQAERPAPEALEDVVATAEAPEASAERDAAAEQVITLMMEDPAAFEPETAQRLAKSPGFNPAQKAVLESFTAAHAARNALSTTDQTNNSVMTGTEGFKGLNEYVHDTAAIVRAGDKTKAATEFAAIEEFQTSHQTKEAAYTQAIEMAQSTGAPIFVLNTPDNGWHVASEKPWNSRTEQGQVSGFTVGIHPKQLAAAGRVRDSITTEVEAITATANSMKHQFATLGVVATEAAPVSAPLRNTGSPEVSQTTDQTVTEESPEADQEEKTFERDETDDEALARLLAEPTPAAEDSVDATIDELFPSGELSTIDSEETVDGNLPEDKFKGRNLIAAYFNQSKTDPESGTANPLVQIRNFLGELFPGGTLNEDALRDAVKLKDKLTGIQAAYLGMFNEFANTYAPMIKANIAGAKVQDAFRFQDYTQFLKGDTSGNITTAISVAAFTWLAENAGGKGFNDDATIRAILGVDDEHRITNEEYALLSAVGSRQNLIIQELGGKVAQALGLRANDTAPVNSQAQLELSLGSHAMAVLVQSGMVVREDITSEVLQREDSKRTKDGKAIPQPFIRVKRDEAGVPAPAAEQIVIASKNTGGIMEKLFSVQPGLVAPETTPGRFKQETTKRTLRKIPEALKQIATRVSRGRYQVRPDMQKLRGALSHDTIMLLAGATDPEGRLTQVNRVKSLQAKNDAVEREIERMAEFEASDASKGFFYFVPNIWSQQRAGLKQNLVNPQASKYQRHNVSMAAWKTPLDTLEKARRFQLAVAQGMGIKVDKLRDAKSLQKLHELMKSPLILAALEAIDAVQEGEELSQVQQNAIVAAVADRENFHTVDALVQWNNFQKAKEAKVPFETDMMFEVDGVTNGPALAHILLGHASGLGKQFGMYSKGEDFTGYTNFKEDAANQDLYEMVAASVQDALYTTDGISPRIAEMVLHFTGKLTDDTGAVVGSGRNLVKQPLTAMVFGSSTGSAIADMAESLVELFYERLEKAANNPDPVAGLADARDSVEQINTVLFKNQKLKIPNTLTEAMELTFTSAAKTQVKEAFEGSVGKAVRAALEENFRPFLDTRQEINDTAKAVWARYDAAYHFMYEQRLTAKIADQSLPVDGAGNPLQDLSKADIDEIVEILKPIAPIVHTAMSKGGDLDAGLDMFKIQRTMAKEENKAYTQEVRFGNPVPRLGMKPTKSITARGLVEDQTDPGVRTVIMLVHALDSAIASSSYGKWASLNIHDALGLSMGNTTDGAKSLNKNTLKHLTEYSLPMEVAAALERSLTNQAQLIESHPELEAVLNKVQIETRIDGIEVKLPVDQAFLDSANQGALTAEQNKLEFLADLELVDQYALEGGSHTVTAKEKAAIARKQHQNQAALGASDLAAEIVEEEATPSTPVTERPMPEDTPWGVVGQSGAAHDNNLVTFLENNPETTARAIIPLLKKRFDGPPQKAQEWYGTLLGQIAKRIDLDMPINYITPFTESPAKTTGLKTANAWYILDSKGERIGIKSADFKHSAVDAITVMHELTHASVAQVIHGVEKGTVTDPRLVEAVIDLEAVRGAAEKYIADNDLTDFKPAVKNVQELVAWGMTDPRFGAQVLSNLEMGSEIGARTTARAESSGLRQFIRSLVKIFFTKKQDTPLNESGMGALIAATGVLMEVPATTENSANIKLRMDATAAPMTFTSEQVFEALEGDAVLNPDYSRHLKGLLGSVVSAVYGNNTAIKREAERTAPVTADDVYLNALAEGRAPFASKLTAVLRMTDQEAFVAESLEVAVREMLNDSVPVQNELRTLWAQAKKEIDPSDLPTGAWDLIFTATSNQAGGSDYLSQFAAASLAYEPLYTKLQSMRTTVGTESYHGKPFAEKLKLFFTNLMTSLGRFITKTHAGQRVGASIEQLGTTLARIEMNRKATLIRNLERADHVVTNSARQLSEKARAGVAKVAGSEFFKNNRSKTFSALGSVTATVAGDRSEQFLNALQRLRDGEAGERNGLAAEILNEMRGERDINAWAHALLAQANTHEQTRKHIMAEAEDMVRRAFGRELTKPEMEALTPILMRADMSSLMDTYSLGMLEDMLSNPSALEVAIRDHEADLAGDTHELAYLSYSKDLAYFIATGQNKNENLLMNAHNIALLANTDQQMDGGQEANQEIINRLVSLYALKYMPKRQKDLVADIMREESRREGGGNGVEFVLKNHQVMQQTALENLFEGSEVHMMKGYTKEIFNPHIEIKAATAAEGAQLEMAGYVKVTEDPLPQDPIDPTADERFLYTVNGRGLSPTITGFLSSTGRTARGYEIHGDILSWDGETQNVKNARVNSGVRAQKAPLINAQHQRARNYDPRNDATENKMAPVLNEYGQAVNYRYLMEETTKDNLLERDGRLDRVLGHMAGSEFDKAKTPGLNEKGIDALREVYDIDYAQNPTAYVAFGPDSADPVIRERYRLLPDGTKRYIKQVWGDNEMMIRKDAYNIAFGYRKFSLGDMFDKSPEHRGAMENIAVAIIQHIPYWNVNQKRFMVLGEKAALRIAQAENMWQELVKVVKDIWVIKNLFTLLGNESSNLTLLMLAGVPIKDIVKNKVIAYQATFAYQNDRKERDALQRQIDIGYITGQVLVDAQQRVVELEDAMQRNPVKELVDAGMFQTLVEDIGNEEDPYSYKSRITRFVDDHTGADSQHRGVQALRTAGKTLLMTHDTPFYKLMNQATVMSDFTSRYTLHQYQTNRTRNPLDQAESLRRARAYFVNYDIPTHKALQYLNDTGLLWFTKYYLRIQAVILQLVRENPLGALSILGINDYVGGISDILDSSMTQKWPGNLGMGALEAPMAVDEIITLRTLGL